MKKGTLFSFFLITIIGFTVSSCKLKVEDANLYDKPGVNVTAKQVTLIIPRINTETKYINVYRRDKQNDDVINIGILYHPLALENDKKNYSYIDSLVKTGHSYEYRVRYNIKGEYFLSEWSDRIEIKDDYDFYDDSVEFAYQTDNAKMIFEKTDNTLTIEGTITEPTFEEFASEHYKTMLIIKSDKATQAFEISSTANNTQIPLIGLLPNSFLDTDISVEGIVGQKIIYADDDENIPENERQIKSIIWTEPAAIEIEGAGSAKKIKIASQTGSEGLDYSRKAK